jgi:hypothetical protein
MASQGTSQDCVLDEEDDLFSLQEMFAAFKELLNGDDIVTEDLEDGCRRIVVLLGCFGLIAKPVCGALTGQIDSLQLIRTECEEPHYRTVRCLVKVGIFNPLFSKTTSSAVGQWCF